MSTLRTLRTAAACVALAACGERAARQDDTAPAPPVLHFDTVRVRLASTKDTVHVLADLAASREQQTLGLMERRVLSPEAGMLFIYDSTQPPTAAFWMYRTRIPLDIAYADSAGVIRAIHRMEPCASDVDASACPTYPAGAPYRSALEVNAGFFASRRIAVGDRLEIIRRPERE